MPSEKNGKNFSTVCRQKQYHEQHYYMMHCDSLSVRHFSLRKAFYKKTTIFVKGFSKDFELQILV